MKKLISLALALALLCSAMAQDKPEPIAKEDLPPTAVCTYCVTLGTMMTPAMPTHGVRYRGKRYFFHSKEMYEAFMKDPEAFADPVLPRPMPKLSVKTSRGTKIDEKYFEDKVILIDFWATWCEPCKKLMPILDEVLDAHKDEGLQMLSISEDQRKNLYEKFLKENPFQHPVAFDDTKAFRAWHVVTIPAVFLVKNGQVVSQWIGLTDKAVIEEAVKKALQKS